MSEATTGQSRVAYVLKGYPRLSEVFITSEIYRVERLGVPLRLYVIKAADEDVHHDVVRRVRTRPEYLLQPTSLTRARLPRWIAQNRGLFLPAVVRTGRRHPVGLARAAGQALAQSVRARRRLLGVSPQALRPRAPLAPSTWPTGSTAPGTWPGSTPTSRTAPRPSTWLASTITGLPFSFTGHAKDIYTEELNPAGLLRRKMDAASFVVTCTEANRRHLSSLGSPTPVHVLYHGLNADFEPLVATGARRDRAGRVRLLAVGRLVRKKGLDTLVDACALLRDRGLDFEAVIAGESGESEQEVRDRVAAGGLEGRVTLLGPLTQDALFEEYQRASVFALPCRVLEDGDRDGIPNVLMEAMACSVPVVTTGVSGITELVHDGENGLIVEPDRPGDLADALHRLVKDPGLAHQLAEQGRHTVAERFDAATTAGRMASLLTGGGSTDERIRGDPGRPGRPAATGVLPDRGAASGPARGPGRDLRPVPLRRRDPRPRTAAGLAARRARRRRGVAHRVEQVLLRSRSRPRVLGHRRPVATSTPGRAWSPAGSTSASPTATRPRSPPVGFRTGSTPGRGSTGCPVSPGWTPSWRTGCWPAWPRRSTTSRPTSPPSATTAPSSCSRSWSSSLGLPVLDPGGVRASRAWADLQDNLLTDVWSDGVHRERSSHYHLIALRSFLAARVNITRFGGHIPPAYDERLRAALRFGMHLHRPDGYVPALSDSDSESYLDLLELAADSLDDRGPALRGDPGARGHAAGRALRRLPGRRLLRAAQRVGDAGVVARRALPGLRLRPARRRRPRPLRRARCRGLRTRHPLVVDPGRYTYAEGSPNWRHWFKGTAAHNTLSVDGLDQQPYRRGKPKGPLMSSRLLDRQSVDGVDLAARRGHQPGVRRRAPADRGVRGRRVLAGLRRGARGPTARLRTALAPRLRPGTRDLSASRGPCPDDHAHGAPRRRRSCAGERRGGLGVHPVRRQDRRTGRGGVRATSAPTSTW